MSRPIGGAAEARPAVPSEAEFDFKDSLEALEIAVESLHGLEALFSAIHELALAEHKSTAEARRRFLAELGRVGAYLAGDWGSLADVTRERLELRLSGGEAQR
jgi:hypothetical protein